MSFFRLEQRRADPFDRLCPTCRRDVQPIGRFLEDGATSWICDEGHASTVPIKRLRDDGRACSPSSALPLFLVTLALALVGCAGVDDSPPPPHESYTGARVCEPGEPVGHLDCVPQIDGGAR